MGQSPATRRRGGQQGQSSGLRLAIALLALFVTSSKRDKGRQTGGTTRVLRKPGSARPPATRRRTQKSNASVLRCRAQQ